MASQAPGAEFLERRLARATAVPPAERSPQVPAFVEANLLQALKEALLHPRQQQEALLRRILSAHSGVDLLRQHADCQQRAERAAELSGGELAALLGDLPLTVYSDHQPAILAALSAAAGPSDGAEFSRQMARVCGQPVTALWCSSGTTGAPKALPECELVVQEQEKVGAAAGIGSLLLCC